MTGYLSVQSLPRRVRICTLPPSSRACMRYPSNLISCSQSGPSGALSTSLASCGLAQVGGGSTGPANRDRGRNVRISGFHCTVLARTLYHDGGLERTTGTNRLESRRPVRKIVASFFIQMLLHGK